jgi:hypothetical protein
MARVLTDDLSAESWAEELETLWTRAIDRSAGRHRLGRA